jgi:hypothetical protein
MAPVSHGTANNVRRAISRQPLPDRLIMFVNYHYGFFHVRIQALATGTFTGPRIAVPPAADGTL